MAAEEMCLLFLDFFLHQKENQTNEEVQCDTVLFNQAVRLREARIVPFGVTIHSELQAEPTLGLTGPSLFEVEFFARRSMDTPTFDRIGALKYDERTGHTRCSLEEVITDLLIVRGTYSTLTLGLFGTCPGSIKSQLPPPQQQQPVSTMPRMQLPMPPRPPMPPQMQLQMPPPLPMQMQQMAPPMQPPLMSAYHQQHHHQQPPMYPPPPFGVSMPPLPMPPPMPPLLQQSQQLQLPPPMPQSGAPFQPSVLSRYRGAVSSSAGFDYANRRPPQMMTPQRPRSPPTPLVPSGGVGGRGGKRPSDLMMAGDGGNAEAGGGAPDADSAAGAAAAGGEDADDDDESWCSEDEYEVAAELCGGSSILLDATEPALDDESLGFPLAFHPDKCVLREHRFPSDPSMTAFEMEKKLLYDSAQPVINAKDEERCEESASRLADLLSQFAEPDAHNWRWVEELERLPAYLPGALAFVESINLAEFETTMDTLVDWTLEGLDLRAARRQQQQDANTFIIRHLKAGIALAGMLCTLDQRISAKLLAKSVQHRLLDLLAADHMATSIKLQVVRALSNTVRLASGADAFLGLASSAGQQQLLLSGTPSDASSAAVGKFVEPPRVLGEDDLSHMRKCLSRLELDTPYKRLVALFYHRHTARVISAMACLLNKLHLYEALFDFRTLFHQFKMAERRVTAAAASVASAVVDPSELADFQQQQQQQQQTPAAKELASIADRLAAALTDIRLAYLNGPQSIGHPKRCLPSGVCFEHTQRPYDCHPDLYHYFNSVRLLDCVRHAICETRMPSLQPVRDAACALLEAFLGLDHGVLYLAAQPLIMQAIVQRLNPDLNPSSAHSVAAGEETEEGTTSSSPNGPAEVPVSPVEWASLALHLVYKLASVGNLDRLLVFHKLHPDLAKAPLAELLLDAASSELMLASLHELYLMSASAPQAGRWLAEVLLTEPNMAVLLPFLEARGGVCGDSSESQQQPPSAKRKRGGSVSGGGGPVSLRSTSAAAAARGYCLSILTACLRYADGGQFVELFAACGDRLLAVVAGASGRRVQTTKSTRLSELADWLAPVKAVRPPYTIEQLPLLLDSLKTWADCLDHRACPPGLVTLLRLLKTLTVPPDSFRSKENPRMWCPQPLEPRVTELRYQYALAELVSADGLNLLVRIVAKLVDQITISWQQGTDFLDDNYLMVLLALEPAVQTLAVMLQSVLKAMAGRFRNYTMLECLFRAFAVVCSFPSASLPLFYVQVIGQIHSGVIDAFLAFSQTALPAAGDHERALDDSQWTCALKQVLELTVAAPCHFLAGLTILGELLPLPLPIHIRSGSKVTESELSSCVNLRKLASAHMLCLAPQVGSVLRLVGGSTNPFINQVFRRVVSQIGDLSCPSAAMLADRATLALLDTWEAFEKQLTAWENRRAAVASAAAAATAAAAQQSEQSSTEQSQQQQQQSQLHTGPVVPLLMPEPSRDPQPDPGELTRALNALNIMLTVASVKLAFLRLAAEPPAPQTSVFAANQSTQCPRDFYTIAQRLLSARMVSDHMLRCQEQLIGCLISLLDTDITLEMPLTKSGKLRVTWQTLANSIPPADQLALLTEAVFRHVKEPTSELATVHLCLKVLVRLSEHDAGFCLVKQFVTSSNQVFLELMRRVNTTFSKDNPDCLNTLLTALELLRTLIITDTLEGEAMPLRSQAVTVGEVKAMLAWQSGAAQEHPVFELHNLLREYAKEEPSLEGLLESMDSLIMMLEQAEDGESQELRPPELPEPQPLAVVFQHRAVFATTSGGFNRATEAEERLQSDYWFGLAAPDESELEPELQRCDLDDLARATCPGLNLREEIEAGAGGRPTGEDAVRHKARRQGHDAIIETSQQRRFVAPMRGRGFSIRPGSVPMSSAGGGRLNDTFRSRPPNTSRPPSMHVDDFEKLDGAAMMDQQQQQQMLLVGDSGEPASGGFGHDLSVGGGGGNFGRPFIGRGGGFGFYGGGGIGGFGQAAQLQREPHSTYGARTGVRRDRGYLAGGRK